MLASATGRICLLGTFVFLLAPNLAFADNAILANPTWEPASDGTPAAGWRIGARGDDLRIDAEDTPPGIRRSLRVDIRKTHSGWGEVTQSVTGLHPDVGYVLIAMVRSTQPRLGVLQIKLYKDGKELQRISSQRSTTEWNRLEQEFYTKGADKVEILCRWGADKPEAVGQSVWFADLKLVELDRPSLVDADVVGTFHSLGLAVNYRGGAGPQHICHVRYRVEGQAEWQAGMDLIAYAPDKQFRGSLLTLAPARRYEIECTLASRGQEEPLSVVRATGQTWSEERPIAEVRTLAAISREPLEIHDQGKPDGWILYRPAEGQAATIDVGQEADQAVVVEEASYVILENVTFRGGRKNGVRLSKSHHVCVRRCDIAGWGDPGTRREGLKSGLYVDERGHVINYQAGVRVSSGCSQTVVEDNFIHHPRGTANSWGYGHPAGPQGVILEKTGGNNVVRNNDVVGCEEHWWNDALESIRNSDPEGGPYRDTDIYGNLFAFSNDDGTELDGGQINVRYWNNWIDKALCGVSCAPNRRGPSYVFRNLIVLTGEERFSTGAGFKMGGNRFPDPGLSLLLHNTIYTTGYGLTAGHYGIEPTPILTRNNLFCGPEPGRGAIRYRHPEDGDFDFDLLPPGGLQVAAPERTKNAVYGEPTFVDADARDFRQAPDSIGIDAGTILPGVNDGFAGQAPDLGLFESDHPDPVFPRREHSFSVLPQRIEFDFVPSDPSSAATFTLHMPPEAGTSWKAFPNSPWLECEPNSGTVTEGPQTVRVRLVGDKLPLRLHRGAVTLRTDTGLNRTVMVDARVYPLSYVALPLEAEVGEISGGMRRVSDEAALGGAYVDTPEDAAGSVRFEFELPVDGDYYVLGRTCVPGPAEQAARQDSFEFSVDEGERLRWDIPNQAPGRWTWDFAKAAYGGGGRHVFPLAAGKHTLTIYSRERLARLDRIVVTNAPYTAPPK